MARAETMLALMLLGVADDDYTPGELFRLIRERSKLGLREAARRSGISHTRISSIESALGTIDMKIETVNGLARAYNMSPHVIADIAAGRLATLDPKPARVDMGPTVRIPFLGTLTAGLQPLGERGQPEIEASLPSLEVLAGFIGDSRPDDCFMVQITAKALACRLTIQRIPPGALVVADAALEPLPGDICLYCLPEYKRGVMGVYQPDAEYVVLESYDSSEPPITVTPETPRVRRGVYIGHWVAYQRQHRRRDDAKPE